MDTSLHALADDLWVVARPHTMLGVHLGSRMTVVRLGDGGLWLHSPVALDEGLRGEVDALGPVRHIVCPNPWHHVYAGAWKKAYPDALLHGPESLKRKRRDLVFDATLGTELDWDGVFAPLHVDGCMLDETVFLHRPSATLVTSDLTENFVEPCGHWLTDAYLRGFGILGGPIWSPALRWMYRDHRAARASIDRLQTWEFERIVLAHGVPIEDDAHAAVEQTFRFLRA